MSSKKPKSKDVSKLDAKLTRKRIGLQQKINEKVFETTGNANKYQAQAMTDLREGLGLLSQYIDDRVSAQQGITSMYRKMNTEDVPELQAQAKAGASFIIDNLGKYYGSE